jgi:hypothetical protein
VLATGRAGNRIHIKDFEELLPLSVVRWNKPEILNGGDRVRELRCSDTDSKDSPAVQRDNSFVRVSKFAFFWLILTLRAVHTISRWQPTRFDGA